MDPLQASEQTRQRDEFVDAYESAWARGLRPELDEFLPAPDHPLRRQVLGRLIRIDLRQRWAQGQPRYLRDYQGRFPELAGDANVLQELAREEENLCQQGQASTRVLPEEVHHRLEDAAQAYQRFRLKTPVGDVSGLDSWCATFAGAPEHAELFREVHRSDPQAAYRLAEALTSLPEVGDTFLGFRLVAELGCGTFGKVYLAQQGDLADRPVALKVAVDLHGESQALAQLQHTNIVPIYSMHRAGPFHAVCMPYLGRTTLADVLRDLARSPRLPQSGSSLVEVVQSHRSSDLSAPETAAAAEFSAAGPAAARLTQQKPPEHLLKRLGEWSYVEAVLWVGARLAAGLAHAHERGILHRDLKPANILLTDDGTPMLADFNLAEDTKLRCDGSVARVGGTLPYMAPEQLLSFEDRNGGLDGRSDVYSLGVILYELLTGRPPFPIRRGPLPQAIPCMIEDRSGPVPLLRPWNRAVSPATESIMRRCLAFDPAQRYQSAGELREDLQRQLDHRPLRYAPEPSLRERLRKWVWRHPRLTARVRQGSMLVALLATFALGIQVIRARDREDDARRQEATEAEQRGQAVAEKEALERLRRFRATMHTLGQLQDALTTLPGAVSTWPGDDARRRWAESLLRAAIKLYRAEQRPGWQEQPAVLLLGRRDRVRLRNDLGFCYYLLARLTAGERDRHVNPARLRQALELNRAGEECCAPGRVPRGLLMQRASLLRLLGRSREADQLDAEAQKHPLRKGRDLYLAAYEQAARGQFRAAVAVAEQALHDEPGRLSIEFLLAVCHDNLFQNLEAIGCYGTCIALCPGSARSYFQRGAVRLRRRTWAKAAADFSQVLRLRPKLADAFANRAAAHHGLKQYEAERDDLTEALKLRPSYIQGYFARAAVYTMLGNKKKAAVDRAQGFKRQPDDEDGYLAQADAYLNNTPPNATAALAAADAALKLNPFSLVALQLRGEILADRLDRTRDALLTLDRAIGLYPDHAPLWANRGLLRARLGQRRAALADAHEALYRNAGPEISYQVGCVYAQTSRKTPADRRTAVEYLKAGVRGGIGFGKIWHDRDLQPLAKDDAFNDLLDTVLFLAPKDSP